MKDYKSLKTANKVSVNKTESGIYELIKKNYDSNTGEALSDKTSNITIESIKETITSIEKDITYLTNKKADYEQLKIDLEAL